MHKSEQSYWNKLFTESVNEHIRLVRLVCDQLNEVEGMSCQISQYEISYHDRSKLDSFEFELYARHFFGDKGDPEGFQRAWEHHYKTNKHHWQYWLVGYDGVSPPHQFEARPMDLEQVMVMVADWLAASYQYQGLWDFAKEIDGKQGWLNANLGGDSPKIIVHPVTHGVIDAILEKIGYAVGLDCQNAPQYRLVDPFFIDLLKEKEKEKQSDSYI